MTPEQRASAEEELKTMKRKLSVRRNQAGYGKNVAHLEQRIAEVEAELAK